MRLYWGQPRSQKIPHKTDILFVEFVPKQDNNVWIYGNSHFVTLEWCPTYQEILAILKALLEKK